MFLLPLCLLLLLSLLLVRSLLLLLLLIVIAVLVLLLFLLLLLLLLSAGLAQDVALFLSRPGPSRRKKRVLGEAKPDNCSKRRQQLRIGP